MGDGGVSELFRIDADSFKGTKYCETPYPLLYSLMYLGYRQIQCKSEEESRRLTETQMYLLWYDHGNGD